MDNSLGLSGMLLRIEKSSIHDGEGLRTVVFLKGCNLHCLWCSTPESHSDRVELGFDSLRCKSCDACIKKCLSKALSRNCDGRIVLEQGRCRLCFQCQQDCPSRALLFYGVKVSVKEVLHEILKDEVFYFHSGGGVTISGGEPLLQAKFTCELLKGCKRNGLDTAMESSFNVPWQIATGVLPYLNTLFIDVKHSDDNIHEQITGTKSAMILENIVRADSSPELFELVLRLPLIPGLNDDEHNLCATAAFAASLTKLKYLEVLPYHRLGSATYTKLGLDYTLTGLPTPTISYVLDKCRLIKSSQPDLPVKCFSKII